MSRKRTLTAYGTQLDQDRLAVLAEQAGVSVSTWIVDKIRTDYERQFGQTPPSLLRKSA